MTPKTPRIDRDVRGGLLIRSVLAISVFDLPGPTRRKVVCEQCGQVVRDHREIVEDGHTFCRPCVEEPYFTNAREVTWPDMNWVPKPSRRDSAGNNQNKNLISGAKDHCLSEG